MLEVILQLQDNLSILHEYIILSSRKTIPWFFGRKGRHPQNDPNFLNNGFLYSQRNNRTPSIAVLQDLGWYPQKVFSNLLRYLNNMFCGKTDPADT